MPRPHRAAPTPSTAPSSLPAPPALSRERVCQEALALVDQEGLAALSMRRLGARLGVKAMSLYRHVRDKADLLDALHVAVLGDLAPTGGSTRSARGGGHWRPLLGGLARALRAALLRHPNVAPIFTSLPVRAPEAMATIARARAALLDAGFAPVDAEKGINVVGMFTIGHVLFEINARAAATGKQRDATFRFGLEALLDGVAHLNAAPEPNLPREEP